MLKNIIKICKCFLNLYIIKEKININYYTHTIKNGIEIFKI